MRLLFSGLYQERDDVLYVLKCTWKAVVWFGDTKSLTITSSLFSKKCFLLFAYPIGTVLTLKAAINALHSVCPKWYNIGVELDVPIFQLENIEEKASNPVNQLQDTLDYWLNKMPSPSWRNLVDALKAPTVGERKLANEIEGYCSPAARDQSSLSVSNSFIRNLPTKKLVFGNNTTPPPSEGTEKPPFGCGCGKCTFFSFIERDCPTPIPSASSFPYLDLSGLTHEQQQELRGRLKFESQQIMMQFQDLVSATMNSLIRQKYHCTFQLFIYA